IDDLGSRRNHCQNVAAHERIMQNNVRISKQVCSFQREQLWIARSRPNEIDFAAHATHSPRPSFKEYVSVSPQSTKIPSESLFTSAKVWSRALMLSSGVRVTHVENVSRGWRSV